MKRLVLKVGGSELDRPGFVDELVEALKELAQDNEIVLVHGGGKAIARLQEQLQLEPRFVEGLRVTDDASLDVAEMVLSGLVNKRLVAKLVSAGISALGLSGVDGGLLRVVKLEHPTGTLGWVGEIKSTNTTLLHAILAARTIPVVSPISLGLDGHTYNVNADHAATALCCTLPADELTFITNVSGVLSGQQGECLTALSPQETETLIADGTISGGMIPKVRSALSATAQGVKMVRITNLAGLTTDDGTCFHAA